MTPEEIKTLIENAVKIAMAAKSTAPKQDLTPPPPEGGMIKLSDLQAMYKENTALQARITTMETALNNATSEKDSFISENTANFGTFEKHNSEVKILEDKLSTLNTFIFEQFKTTHGEANDSIKNSFDVEKYKNDPLNGLNLLNQTMAYEKAAIERITAEVKAEALKTPGGSTGGGGPAGGNLEIKDTKTPAESQRYVRMLQDEAAGLTPKTP